MLKNLRRKSVASRDRDDDDEENGPLVQIGQYVLGDTLGIGTFGKVKVGFHKMTGHKVAVKIVNREKIKSLDVVGKIRREIDNMKMFCHKHIIKLYQVISTPTDIFMIMEFVSGGELFEYIVKHGKLNEDRARTFFQQIMSGVHYCHRHNVVHRDLKPENLLLDNNLNVKVADFGLSNVMSDGDFLRTSCGSPNYAAPEVISGKLYAGPEVDIWSAGVILYALLCGSLPFDDDNVPMLFRKIKSGIFNVPYHLNASVVSLLRHMLQTDPMKRATMDDVRNHEWFKVNLPPDLFPDHDASMANLDHASVSEVADRLSVEASEVIRAIDSGNMSDPLTVAYRLVVDSKTAMKSDGHAPSLNSSLNEYQEFMRARGHSSQIQKHSVDDESSNAKLSTMTLKPHPERIAPHLERSELWQIKDVDTARYRQLLEQGRIQAHSEKSRDIYESPDASNSAADENVVGEKRHRGAPIKRAKWHLGIRSQSRPYDIMNEVYLAMRTLGFEWKIINPYHVMVRHKKAQLNHFVCMSLQLYQVDQKNYLLDFKSLPSHMALDDPLHLAESQQSPLDKSGRKLSSPISMQVDFLEPDSLSKAARSQSVNFSPTSEFDPNEGLVLKDPTTCSQDTDTDNFQNESRELRGHLTMEFFEMCSALISQLAR